MLNNIPQQAAVLKKISLQLCPPRPSPEAGGWPQTGHSGREVVRPLGLAERQVGQGCKGTGVQGHGGATVSDQLVLWGV